MKQPRQRQPDVPGSVPAVLPGDIPGGRGWRPALCPPPARASPGTPAGLAWPCFSGCEVVGAGSNRSCDPRAGTRQEGSSAFFRVVISPIAVHPPVPSSAAGHRPVVLVYTFLFSGFAGGKKMPMVLLLVKNGVTGQKPNYIFIFCVR